MDSYSHGAFQVSGYKVSLKNKETMVSDIQAAWSHFMSANIGEKVEHKEYPHLHTIYYHFADPTGPHLGYDMLIGYVTKDGSTQSDPSITTVLIPPQNYKYKKFAGNPKEILAGAWKEVNSMPTTEVARTYQYDMEMFNEEGNEVTVAVSVV